MDHLVLQRLQFGLLLHLFLSDLDTLNQTKELCPFLLDKPPDRLICSTDLLQLQK